MAATRIQEWERQRDATDNPELKNILQKQIDAYSLAIQDGSVSSAASGKQVARYNPLIGGKSQGGLRLVLYISKALSSGEYLKYAALRILPFKDVENTATVHKEDNDHTLVFDLSGDDTFRWTTLTKISLSIYAKEKGSIDVVDGSFHVVDGIVVARRRHNGRSFINVNCKSIQPWKEGPTNLQLAELVIRYFSGDRYGLRALPASYLADKSEVYDRLPKTKDQEGNEKPDYNKAGPLFKTKTAENVARFLRENNLPPDTYGHYMAYPDEVVLIPFSVPGIRKFATVPSVPGAPIITCGQVAWTNELIVARGDEDKKNAKDGNPYADKLAATAQSTISRIVIRDGAVEEESFILKATCTHMHYAIGIMNVNNLRHIAGEIIPKIDVVFLGEVDVPAACKMDVNTTAPVYTDGVPKQRIYGIPLKSFQRPYVPVVTMVRTCGVPITKKYAFSVINNYIKLNGGTVKKDTTIDIKVLKQSRKETVASDITWCMKANILPKITQNRVYNLFESETEPQLKLDDKFSNEWHYFSVSNAVFKEPMNRHVQDLLRYHALPAPLESETQRLENMKETFSDALRQLAAGDESEYFALPRFGSSGLFQIVFAVHRSIDHGDDIEVYKNPLFDIENCTPTAAAAPIKPYVYKEETEEDIADNDLYYEAATSAEEQEKQESVATVEDDVEPADVDPDEDTFDVEPTESGEEEEEVISSSSSGASAKRGRRHATSRSSKKHHRHE